MPRLRPHLAKIVNSYIPAETAAAKRLCKATGHMVLFDHDHHVAGSRQRRCTSKPTHTGTNDDCVPGVSV